MKNVAAVVKTPMAANGALFSNYDPLIDSVGRLTDANESPTAGTEWPTAFVLADSGGREIDVHAIALTSKGQIVPQCTVPWSFTDDALDGTGVIGREPVACITARGQVEAHTGYELPEHHVADLAALRAQPGSG